MLRREMKMRIFSPDAHCLPYFTAQVYLCRIFAALTLGSCVESRQISRISQYRNGFRIRLSKMPNAPIYGVAMQIVKFLR